MPKKISLGLEDDDGGSGLVINEAYANRYKEWRTKEERQKLIDRHGKDVLNDDDGQESSESEEDSSGEEDTSVNLGFLKTLASLKAKDPRLYQAEFTHFPDAPAADAPPKPKAPPKDQPMFLKDYDRAVILEKGGRLSSSDDDDSEAEERRKREASPSYAQQQRQLKEGFSKLVEDEDDAEELLTKRVKTTAEEEREEEDYVQWLKGRKKTLPDAKDAKELEPLKEFWAGAKDEGETFLRDYILNRKHKEGDEGLPTYEDIVGEGEAELSEDEAAEEKAEAFEQAYNFRFEEPDPDFIKAYPRTVAGSLRRPDDRRKDKRQAYKERKKHEKEEAQAEVAQLKAMKRKEISEQIAKLDKISGVKSAFDPKDLDGDFDPDEHDRRMAQIFDQEYYEAGDGDEMEKPEIGPDSDLEEEEEAEDPEDWDDYDPNQPSTSQAPKAKANKAPESKAEGKGKTGLAEVLAKPKPVFDPSQKTFAQYLDEYYALDAEGFAGGAPTRFRYRQVDANDFGLDVGEILTAQDKELNAWASLKKTSQYRSKTEEKFDIEAYQRKAADAGKKRRILPSVYRPPSQAQASDSDSDDDEVGTPLAQAKAAAKEEDKAAGKKKRRRGKKRPAEEARPAEELKDEPQTAQNGAQAPPKKKKAKKQSLEVEEKAPEAQNGTAERKQKRKKPKTVSTKEDAAFTEDRLKAYGLNPKKLHNKRKYAPQ